MSFKYEAKKCGYTSVALAVGALALPLESRAYELYNQGGQVLNAKVEAVFAAMHSDENYATTGTRDSDSSNWQEGFVKYGLNGSSELEGKASVYGAFSLLSSGTWGDGDAAGFTEGTERRTAVEDAYLGWRSGSLFLALAKMVLRFPPVARK